MIIKFKPTMVNTNNVFNIRFDEDKKIIFIMSGISGRIEFIFDSKGDKDAAVNAIAVSFAAGDKYLDLEQAQEERITNG